MTHVLLPVLALWRRRDLAEVIGEALEAKLAGAGHRRIARRLDVPADTVRGWLRRFSARASEVREHFTRLAHALGADLGAIEPRASPLADALEAVGVAARTNLPPAGLPRSCSFCAQSCTAESHAAVQSSAPAEPRARRRTRLGPVRWANVGLRRATPHGGRIMVVLVATYRARAGRGDAVAEAMREVVAQTREESGCLLYFVNRSRDDPDTFVIYEHYRDEDAINAHRASGHFQEIVVSRVIPLLEHREFSLYSLVEP